MESTVTSTAFSVVVPLYNKESSVRRAIDSVLNQSHNNFELIVVDDGSDDGSVIRISDIVDHRLKIITTGNGGVSRARNRGIDEATHEWIAFLDADDEWQSSFLQRIAECIQKIPQADVVYSLSAELYGDKQLNRANSQLSEPELINYLDAVTFDGAEEINSSCVCVHKTAFDRAGRFPEGVKLGEDTDTWLRLSWTSNIVQIPEVLSVIHAEVSGRKGIGAIDQHPYWLATYASWQDHNLLSPEVTSRMKAYKNKFVMERTIRLSLAGHRLKAISSFFSDISIGKYPKGLLAKTCAYLLLPISLITYVRMLRQSGNETDDTQ